MIIIIIITMIIIQKSLTGEKVITTMRMMMRMHTKNAFIYIFKKKLIKTMILKKMRFNNRNENKINKIIKMIIQNNR